ncbi:MAG: multicomponent Na+:H+ antiporter subunit B [Candidatus Marinamargulisbacteria bacterium]|jgi:multicomponent Na+:H+ antiporter subunit B
MIWQFDVILLTLVVVCAVGSLFIADLMGAVIVFGAYSFLMCLIWTGMGAVDVAFTEATVGAGVSTVLFLATIYNTSRKIRPSKDKVLKGSAAIGAIVLGGILFMVVPDLPAWGDASSPANSHVAKYYIEHTLHDTNVPNIVTAVLADYRGFDTMFETCVVFVACLGIVAMLRRKPKKGAKTAPYDHSADSLIVQTACRFMVPLIQLFALYVVAHGHHSPGGGFQGGVLLGASLILIGMSYDLDTVKKRISENQIMVLSAVGVLIFAGLGAICMLLGGNFLDYSVFQKIMPGVGPVMARYHLMLGVEIGVALTVMCAMYAIYANLASDGRMDEGL